MTRMTLQKKLLLDEIKSLKSFFDATELYTHAAKKDKQIGLATIYRFLTKLEQDGILHSFLCENRKIYSMGKTNHAHFTCEHCGQIKHIIPKNVDFLRASKGDEICHFQIELAGICSACKEKERTE